MLTEAERNILLTEPPAPGDRAKRSRRVRWSAPSATFAARRSFNRQVLGDVSATLNTEVEHNEGRSLIGLGDTLLEPLAREHQRPTARMPGLTLNGDKAQWHWNVTGNADWDRRLTEYGPRRRAVSARPRPRDDALRATSRPPRTATLFKLPAGNAGDHAPRRREHRSISTRERRASGRHDSANSLGRTTGTAAVNFDLPISRRGRDFSALGNLTLNANAEIDQLSDFGTLTKIGAGANWSPVDRLNFIDQLDPRGRPADDQPARRSAARHAGLADLRLHDRPDGACHRAHRRQSGPAGRPPQRVQARRLLAAVATRPTCTCAPTTCTRRSSTRSPTSA